MTILIGENMINWTSRIQLASFVEKKTYRDPRLLPPGRACPGSTTEKFLPHLVDGEAVHISRADLDSWAPGIEDPPGFPNSYVRQLNYHTSTTYAIQSH